MIVLIKDDLVNPPTEFAAFRDLTLWCVVLLGADVLVETDDPDPYYRWLKPRGGMDFIREMVRVGSESGVRVDRVLRFPKTVLAERIIIENRYEIFKKVASFS